MVLKRQSHYFNVDIKFIFKIQVNLKLHHKVQHIFYQEKKRRQSHVVRSTSLLKSITAATVQKQKVPPV